MVVAPRGKLGTALLAPLTVAIPSIPRCNPDKSHVRKTLRNRSGAFSGGLGLGHHNLAEGRIATTAAPFPGRFGPLEQALETLSHFLTSERTSF